MRERQTQKQLKLLNNRITPACAGKTVTKATHSLGNGDHPRMCGKDTRNMLNPALASGSPPHVRERPVVSMARYSSPRITPACAGKTRYEGLAAGRRRDHPRMCGKDEHGVKIPSGLAGSPPHVRERLVQYGVVVFVAGITPACAGKTYYIPPLSRLGRDHPRMCGKDICLHGASSMPLGSPPHVRERRKTFFFVSSSLRITPACAGKT